MVEATNFRQRLDAVLRTRDVKQVQGFLIAEKQWDVSQPADPEFAMWMMIAGSSNLRDLHQQARQWLVGHGHEAEADALVRRENRSGGKPREKPAPGDKRTGGKSASGRPQKQPGIGQQNKGRM